MNDELIETIFDKPGTKWVDDEIHQVQQWLFSEQTIRRLLLFVLMKLGRAASAEDAEDALIDFWIRNLSSVIETYDPSKGVRFWNYLLLCLGRFCRREGEKIQQIRKREQRIAGDSTEAYDSHLESVSLDLMPDAEAALISKEFIEALEKCFNKIPSRYSEVLTMKYLEEKTIAEIAENLNISYSNVKIRLYRARQLLAECLRKSGVIQ